MSLCHLCLKAKNHIRQEYLCPVCEGLTRHLGLSHNIQPFWLRIPAFFAYPFNPSTLFYIAGLVVLTVVAVLFPVGGVLVFVFVLYAILKYAFSILEHTARGHLHAPDSGMSHLAKNTHLPLKQMMLLLSLSALIWATQHFVSPTLGIVLGLFLLLMLPASTMLLGVTGNLLQAANPWSLVQMISAIGLSYALLTVLILLISSMGWVIEQSIQAGLPLLLGLPLGIAVMSYFVVANFHLLGYVIYQFHDTLGYNASEAFDPEGEETDAPHPVDPIHQEVLIVLSERGYPEAKDRLKKKILSEPNNIQLHHFCHQFMLEHHDETAIPRHAQQYIPLLIADGQQELVLVIARRCFHSNPEFKLKHAANALQLGQIAYDKADFKLALKVFTLFRQQFPGHKGTVNTQFLCAKIYAQHRGDKRQAKMIMRSLVGRHSNHSRIDEMKAFLAEL